MWLIGSAFEIESCGRSQFQEEKTLNSRGPGDRLSRAYLGGSDSGREGKEMNLANRKTPRMHKKKRKKNSLLACSEILFLYELSAKGSVQKFTPWHLPLGWGIIRRTAQDKAAEQWVSSRIRMTIMSEIVVFGERRVLCKNATSNPAERGGGGLFVLPSYMWCSASR